MAAYEELSSPSSELSSKEVDDLAYLSAAQVEAFHRDGFLVIPSFWTSATCATLRARIGDIMDKTDFSNIKSTFSTKEQERVTDDYFLSSGREIRFFWEAKAYKDGVLNCPPALAVNKIGHGLHDLVPEFEAVSYEARVGAIAHDLGLVKPLACQSMYIFKQPRIGGEVCPHQDGAFLYTEPQSVLGYWWPLDDCTQENGCLWAVPGSHNLGVHRRYRRKDVDDPSAGVEFVPPEPDVWSLENAVPVECGKGALVLIHSAVVHYSAENTSDTPRHAYSIHVIDGKDGVAYPADNWLQRPAEFPFRQIEY
jgi:phytanoyl-CoA hydroxylase